jgi:internalin A
LANLPLTALLLDNNQISDIGPLMSIPELQALSISNNPLADIAVLGNPGSFSALTILVMDNVGLSNQEFTVMLSNQFPNLKALSISNNSYCGILACFRLSILDPLKVMPNLTELRAESNSITNLTPLSSVQSLQRLSLSGNGVTTASLDIFTTVSFPALNYFDLSNNKITNVLPLASMGSKVAMSLNLFANQIDTYIGNIDQLGKLQPGSTVDLRSNPNMSCDELDVLNKIFSGANPPSSVLPYPYVVNQDCRIPII